MTECNITDIGCLTDSWYQGLKDFALDTYQFIVMSFADLIDLIPIPDFFDDMQTYTVPANLAFFVEPFQLEYGIGIVVSAYIARFIVRRLPVVG